MPSYIIYDKSNGQVMAVHREILAETEATVALPEKEVMAAAGFSAEEQLALGVLAVDERPPARRGYRLYVDPNLKRLVELEAS